MKKIKTGAFIIIVFSLVSCGEGDRTKDKKETGKSQDKISIPVFNPDSAFGFVKKQVEFGPRVPNTENHIKCGEYLVAKLIELSDTVHIQSFKTRAYDGTLLNGRNIIGSFNPKNKNRILLCAHWDTRPFADHDPNPDLRKTPIDGANDGASGVGILLEIARQLHSSRCRIGVDIFLIDAEDYGPPHDLQRNDMNDYYCLGSQYWAKNPHDPDYVAKYAILLDMVGAKNARFYMEGFSLNYASGILKKVWNTAHRMGYESYFVYEQAGYIDDDHKYINEIAKIPAIDIIHLDPESSNSSFFEYWHTTGDKIDKIDRESLMAVGQTLLTVIFEEQ
ncbi:MAG: M28 family peptidase [Bacteroidetes bacterium]|nr:M28 family peptidase [Bacteroidota bacterium]